MGDPLTDAPVGRPLHPPRHSLAELGDWLATVDPSILVQGELDVVVTGLTLSSQRVVAGDVYAALPGSRAHGIEYAAQAQAAGAVAVLTDAAGVPHAPSGMPVLGVAEPRALLGRLAAYVYDEPARSLRMLGVTGTQGKTTTTRLAESALQRAGTRSAV